MSWLRNGFELIEDEIDTQEINIQEIKEIEYYYINGVGEKQDEYRLTETDQYLCEPYNGFEMIVIRKINELAQAVKQLDKKLKEKD